MAFTQYLNIDGTDMPLPVSYDLALSDVEADSSGKRKPVRLSATSCDPVLPRYLHARLMQRPYSLVATDAVEEKTIELNHYPYWYAYSGGNKDGRLLPIAIQRCFSISVPCRRWQLVWNQPEGQSEIQLFLRQHGLLQSRKLRMVSRYRKRRKGNHAKNHPACKYFRNQSYRYEWEAAYVCYWKYSLSD
jgi:hypothetical protein